ncbi:hypothetical protein UA08_01642 [Talaromyces atroroseus]|uniref:DUF7820 domain-containing protein n=1 Tax=Talaromyces atroroseus TaxID=1441469 RepID=A0A1Q5QAC3_TALAT|nr:hypothetical protein UA08_01642 [Talaromyces atroroseus]OKL62709.1 hypothetical protein UA08_01642 [Talaromyces atroroseus]
MAGHNDGPRDSIDSSLPQMVDMVPADGSLFRPPHTRQSSNPNVFSDDYTIDSVDAPLFSNHRRSASISSLDSASTIEPRYHNLPKPGTESNSARANSRPNQPPVVSPQQSEESLPLHRTASYRSEASTTPDEDADLDPFTDDQSPSHTTTAAAANRPSSIRKDVTSMNRRSVVSTTSTRSGYNPLPRAMSPYRGATGPSHPYAMYPQVGVSRAASVATVSSIRRADSPMRGRTAPQHPYGMYPQIIDYEEDLGDQPIPVGFSAAGGLQSHQASSPEADDVGDIVGPDGHLEQLPPYSRYPDGVVRPMTGRGPASIASDMRGQSERYQDEPSAPATATARPDASSRTLINVDSSEPLHPSTSQSDRSSTLVETMSEKINRKGRQKCCGAPIWLIVVLLMAMVVCALLGGVIGGVLGERAATRRAQSTGTATASVVTVTYTSDVSPYTATPTGFAALPTGNYQVPWTTTNVSKFCIGASNQMAAWSCQVMDPLSILVQGVIEASSVTVKEPGIQNDQFNYGAQLPYDIEPAKQNLSMMIDKEDPQLGPALFFQTLFNKLVIVEDTQDIQSKRSINERDSANSNGFVQGENAGNGAKPWFCWWNQTQIETFIYINQTQDTTGSSSPSSSSTQAIPVSTSAAGAGSSKRDTTIPGYYPRKVKIKENRVNPNAPQAYCQQMQVNSDNSVTPIHGQTFKINESITTHAYSQQSSQVPCYCEWLT